MDAVMFLKEKCRMCKTMRARDVNSNKESCENCPIEPYCGDEIFNPESAVSVVEKWAAEHPIKTNRQKYEEVFGTTFGAHQVAIGGLPCPARSPEYCGTHRCDVCRKWWDEPYKGAV